MEVFIKTRWISLSVPVYLLVVTAPKIAMIRVTEPESCFAGQID